MDVKGAFERVGRNRLMRKIDRMGAEEKPVRWADSFMSERKVSLMVDSHQYDAVEIEMGVPRGSPVSPILLGIYHSRIFKKVKEDMEGCMAKLFADDCEWLVTANLMAQLCERLEIVEMKTV